MREGGKEGRRERGKEGRRKEGRREGGKKYYLLHSLSLPHFLTLNS